MDYGSVTYNGETYTLDNDAELTNRLFPGCWSNAKDGETYTAEWAADAHNEHGQCCKVVWQWQEEKGQELEDASSYPWDTNIYRIIEQ